MDLVTSASIAAAFGFVLSFALAFLPGVKKWFAAIGDDYTKRAIVLGFCFLLAVGLVAFACAGVETGSGAVCPTEITVAVVYAFLANVLTAAGAAQTTFALLVSPIKESSKG